MPTMMQVTLRSASNVPADFMTNQFCIDAEPSTTGEMDDYRDAAKAFYDAINANLLSDWVAQAGHIVKLYMLPGLLPNYPFYESTFNLASSPSGTALPHEVSIALSFQGVKTAGMPQARRRGRIFIPAIDASANSGARPSATARTTLVNAAQEFYTDLLTVDPTGPWAVWSVTDSAAVPLANCWVDDAFDTVRSRGVAPTSRTSLVFT